MIEATYKLHCNSQITWLFLNVSGVSIDELIENQNKGLGTKLASLMGFLRPRRKREQKTAEKVGKLHV